MRVDLHDAIEGEGRRDETDGFFVGRSYDDVGAAGDGIGGQKRELGQCRHVVRRLAVVVQGRDEVRIADGFVRGYAPADGEAADLLVFDVQRNRVREVVLIGVDHAVDDVLDGGRIRIAGDRAVE